MSEEMEMDAYPVVRRMLMSCDTYYRRLILGEEDPEEVMG